MKDKVIMWLGWIVGLATNIVQYLMSSPLPF